MPLVQDVRWQHILGYKPILWCLSCPHAAAIAVEQPGTIVLDFIDLTLLPRVVVQSFRTGQLGDAKDKIVRLASRNLTVPLPHADDAVVPIVEQRTLFRYGDAKARDRCLSFWAPFSRTRAALFGAGAGLAIELLDYLSTIMTFVWQPGQRQISECQRSLLDSMPQARLGGGS